MTTVEPAMATSASVAPVAVGDDPNGAALLTLTSGDALLHQYLLTPELAADLRDRLSTLNLS